MRNPRPVHKHRTLHQKFHSQSVAILSAMGFSKDEIGYITQDEAKDERNQIPLGLLCLAPDFNFAKPSDAETPSDRPIEIPYSPEAMLKEVFRIARQRSQPS